METFFSEFCSARYMWGDEFRTLRKRWQEERRKFDIHRHAFFRSIFHRRDDGDPSAVISEQRNIQGRFLRGLLKRRRLVYKQQQSPSWVKFLISRKPLYPGILATSAAIETEKLPPVDLSEYVEGNDVTFFDETEPLFECMLDRIEKAKKRIWLETYCIDENTAARVFVNALSRAASQGVDVVISVDGAGSLGVPENLRKEFRQQGGHLVIFNPLWRPVGPLVYRNHRKVLVCDDEAFCGSANIDWRACSGSTWTQRTSPQQKRPFYNINRIVNMIFRDNSAFRPTDYNHACLIRGPAVHRIAQTFCQVLKKSHLPLQRDVGAFESSKDKILSHTVHSLTRNIPTLTTADAYNVPVKILQADGSPESMSDKRSNNYSKSIIEALELAKASVVVVSSYFHPPFEIRQALAKKFRSGIPSLLLLSGLSDVPFDAQATLATLPYFLVRLNFS